MERGTLYDRLIEYGKAGLYPFHMPGHKRNIKDMPLWSPWQIDMTEVEGTDNLYHARGILKEAMDRCAALWGADHSYFLVNGSTGGILSAVAAVCCPGDMVLVARNCHKSVYHALFLNHLRAVYVVPEQIAEYGMSGGIAPQSVERMLEQYPQIRAVILTSPTYEGIVSDIGAIAKVTHKRGAVLLVDEAHGAHFGWADFPVSALREGADIVIQSCHKTLPALTQTGLLHLRGSLVDRERIKECLSIYQTSSPSYLLMASIDYAAAFLEGGQERMWAYSYSLHRMRERAAQLSHIVIPGRELVGKNAVYDVDNSKVILALCGKAPANGKWLYERLRCNYHLQCEMAMEGYALLITSVMDKPEGFERFMDALRDTDKLLDMDHISFGTEKRIETAKAAGWKGVPESAVLTVAEAFYAKKEEVLFHEAAGRISGDYLYLYPPGTPLLVPGERIEGELIERAEHLKELGFELQGLKDGTGIRVCLLDSGREGTV